MNTRSVSTEKSIRKFCVDAKTRFEESSDFDSQRKFLEEYIERIIFGYGRITIVGNIPIESVSPEKTTLPFQIEGEIDDKRSRIQAKLKI